MLKLSFRFMDKVNGDCGLAVQLSCAIGNSSDADTMSRQECQVLSVVIHFKVKKGSFS